MRLKEVRGEPHCEGEVLAGWGAAGKEGEARPLGPHCHLPHPFPAPALTTFGRKGAHSQWGPVRVLKG